MGNAKLVDVPFAAPVPRGHQAAWARIEQQEAGKNEEVIIDMTTGIVYCPEAIRGLFEFPNADQEPLRDAARYGWKVTAQLSGRVVGATLATTSTTHGTAMRTALFFDTSPAAYR